MAADAGQRKLVDSSSSLRKYQLTFPALCRQHTLRSDNISWLKGSAPEMATLISCSYRSLIISKDAAGGRELRGTQIQNAWVADKWAAIRAFPQLFP